MLNPYTNTIEDRVLSSNPTGLISLLLEGLSSSVETARTRLKSGDIPGRASAITRAEEIVAELAGSLDLNAGGALATQLQDIYLYMFQRLQEANANQTEAPLAEVSKLTSVLREAWEEIGGQRTTAPATQGYSLSGSVERQQLSFQG